MTVVDLTSGNSLSSWIESTSPHPGEENVSRVNDFVVYFTRSVASEALVSSKFWLQDSSGNIVNIFNPIDIKKDYHSINKKLTLHLSRALDPETEYIFVISELYDPTGAVQDFQHVVKFETASGTDTLNPIAHEAELTAEDKRLASRPIDIILNEMPIVEAVTGPKLVRSIPTNGAYGISETYNNNTVDLYFDKNVESIQLHVSKQAVSAYESLVEAVPTDITVSGQNVKVSVAEGFTAAYTYTIALVEINGEFIDHNISFTTVLPDLRVSINEILAYGRFDPQSIARQIYLAGLYVQEVASLQPGVHNVYASDYVKYATLYHFSLQGSSMSEGMTITLGDLSIAKKSGSSSGGSGDASARWRLLMEEALAKLIGSGRAQTSMKGIYDTVNVNDRDYRSGQQRFGDRRLMY